MDSFVENVLAVVPRLRAFTAALVRNSSLEADDLVQDGVVEMLASRANYADGNFDGWAFTIQRRLVRKRLRGAAMFPERQDPSRMEDDASLPDSLICAPGQIDSAHLREVGAAIDALPADKREVIHLVAVEGLGYAEIAAILEESESAVRSRIHHARRAVAEAMADRAVAPEARHPERGTGRRRAVAGPVRTGAASQPGRRLGSLPGSRPNRVRTGSGSGLGGGDGRVGLAPTSGPGAEAEDAGLFAAAV